MNNFFIENIRDVLKQGKRDSLSNPPLIQDKTDIELLELMEKIVLNQQPIAIVPLFCNCEALNAL